MTTTSWRSGRIWLIAFARSEAVAGAVSGTTRPLTTRPPGRSSVKSKISIDLLTQIIIASDLPMLRTVNGEYRQRRVSVPDIPIPVIPERRARDDFRGNWGGDS